MKKPTIKAQAYIIDFYFNPPPAIRAAKALHDMGLQSKDLNRKYMVKVPPFLGDPIVMSVYNAMRDIERTSK